MKKFLPVIILVVGVLLVGGIFAFNRLINTDPSTQEEHIPELPEDQRPYTSLTPTDDGHRIALKIENINVEGAYLLDYQLLYTRGDGIEQGTSGVVENLTPGHNVEELLLLGSESNGKFRYDEGVEFGTLILKFIDKDGKSIGKAESDFHLQQNAEVLTSSDGSFEYELDDVPEDVFFITMDTFKGYEYFSSDGETY